MVISYADPAQRHAGGIYQATNWIYQGEGLNLMPNYSVSLTKEPYKWIHSRTVFSKFGSHNIEKLKKAIGTGLWGVNLLSTGGVKAFDMEDLRPYFDNDDHFEYAKGHPMPHLRGR